MAKETIEQLSERRWKELDLEIDVFLEFTDLKYDEVLADLNAHRAPFLQAQKNSSLYRRMEPRELIKVSFDLKMKRIKELIKRAIAQVPGAVMEHKDFYCDGIYRGQMSFAKPYRPDLMKEE